MGYVSLPEGRSFLQTDMGGETASLQQTKYTRNNTQKLSWTFLDVLDSICMAMVFMNL